MRTTITLDADVAQQLKAATSSTGRPFRAIVNDALRRGLPLLRKPRSKPYRMKPHDMGIRPGISLDNIGDLLAHIEGETWR
jgi:hypothetical protein